MTVETLVKPDIVLTGRKVVGGVAEGEAPSSAPKARSACRA